MFMPCMRRCSRFFSFCVHDVSAHTVFVAVISQMKDFFTRNGFDSDEDEWRRKDEFYFMQLSANASKSNYATLFFGWAKQ